VSETFEVISREAMKLKNNHNGNKRSPLTVAVLATAESGDVVRVELNGRKRVNVYNTLYHIAGRYGLQLRTRSAGTDALYLWVEKGKSL
jgi:hypothetical protein